MTKLIKIHDLKWDTGILGVKSSFIDLLHKNLEEPFKNIVEKIQKSDSEFLTIKLAKTYTPLINNLLGIGAKLVDCELTYVFNKKTNLTKIQNNNCEVIFLKTVDHGPFLQLANSMDKSRFFMDKNICKEKAIYLWEQSIKNHCCGRADMLAVAYVDKKPAGIITINFLDRKTINLHIVGVLKDYQGQKIGTTLINNVVKKYSNVYNIVVETQSTNIAAQKLYEKSGFVLKDLKYVLHYWRKN